MEEGDSSSSSRKKKSRMDNSEGSSDDGLHGFTKGFDDDGVFDQWAEDVEAKSVGEKGNTNNRGKKKK